MWSTMTFYKFSLSLIYIVVQYIFKRNNLIWGLSVLGWYQILTVVSEESNTHLGNSYSEKGR